MTSTPRTHHDTSTGKGAGGVDSAAHRAGLKTIILPRKNDKDLVDVPKSARRDLRFVFVEHMDTVLAEALFPAVAKASDKAKAAARRTRPARPAARPKPHPVRGRVAPRIGRVTAAGRKPNRLT